MTHKIGILLGNGYYIDKVIVAAKDKNYYPYICGCLIKHTQNRKRYCLDTFGFELLCKTFGIYVMLCYGGVKLYDIDKELIGQYDTIYGDKVLSLEESLNTNEKVMSAWSKVHKSKFIERNEILEGINKYRAQVGMSC
jgi:hypothetical protein